MSGEPEGWPTEDERARSDRVTRLPPGPTGTLWSTLRYLRDPYGTLLQDARRYGDTYLLPSFLGKMVLTGHPEGARAIFSADPDTFVALGAELLGPVLGESNLILLSGERHRSMRKLQGPPFHGARMRVYGQIILDVAREHTDRWPREGAFSVHRTMQEVSLDVILRAVLGLSDGRKRDLFREAVLDLIGSLKPSFMFIRRLRRSMGGLSAWARFRRRQDRVRQLFQAELRERRAAGSQQADILSLLLAARFEDGSPMSDEDVMIQMLNLIGAGHETTASSLAWALDHLHREPAVLGRLIEELASLPASADPEAIARLPYLDAVCAETLRLDPVAPMIGRTLRKSFVLDGYELPPGCSVAIGILNIHRRPDLYPEPERFRPERFMEREYSAFEYLPFGGGARRCLGAAMALYEMKLVLATVLQRHRLSLDSAAPARAAVRNTTVGPATGVKMRLRADATR